MEKVLLLLEVVLAVQAFDVGDGLGLGAGDVGFAGLHFVEAQGGESCCQKVGQVGDESHDGRPW